jgi:hypothetical protein
MISKLPKRYKQIMRVFLVCIFQIFCLGIYNIALSQIALQLISGADGEFNTINLDSKTVYQSKGSPGAYAPYIYAQCVPPIVNKTVYVELTFRDFGYGKITIDYNSATSDYQTVEGKNTFLLDLKGEKTMVFELRDANFQKHKTWVVI